MNSEGLNLPQKRFEPVISKLMELDALNPELTLDVFDIHGSYQIKTCYGDIRKIVDALMDYAGLLEMVCDAWDLRGFHRGKYEFQAEKLRGIARKYQAGIGYDYDAAVEKCRERGNKKLRSDDVGGEAMEMAFLKGQQAAESKKKKTAEKNNTTAPTISTDSPWEENE